MSLVIKLKCLSNKNGCSVSNCPYRPAAENLNSLSEEDAFESENIILTLYVAICPPAVQTHLDIEDLIHSVLLIWM